MCQFQSLYFGDDGYIVRCKDCARYQVAFISTMIMITQSEYEAFCKLVRFKYNEEDYSFTENTKSVFISLPSQKICLLLSRNELSRLFTIVEEAEVEIKSRELIDLFS